MTFIRTAYFCAPNLPQITQKVQALKEYLAQYYNMFHLILVFCFHILSSSFIKVLDDKRVAYVERWYLFSVKRFLENEEAFAAAPDFTNQTLYAKAYRLASVMPFHDVPRGGLMHDIANKADDPWVEDLKDTFATFQDCRRGSQRQALYVIPEMNTSLLGIMSVRFANQAMTNVKEHMTRNLPKYLKNVCTKYADILRQANNNENLAQGLTSGKIVDLQDAYITDGSYRSSALIFLCATRFYNRRFGRHCIVLTMSSDEGGDTGANVRNSAA
ncbi:hypothetical protein BJV82DRAFT_577123 [Fennellomyces sp. T-0311]|nr:hypothetical protein BJV82DRAFT_577123 [Fennellomyces sp. T-0311]